MSRGWTPESQVSTTDAGMIIKVKMHSNVLLTLRIALEEDRLILRGQHEKFGSFEIKFDIPSGYNLANLKSAFVKGIFRIEIPPGKNAPQLEFPQAMLIYCNGCGKHFDIIITDRGPHDYICPACGKVQIFDLEALVNQVMEQHKKRTGKNRGRM